MKNIKQADIDNMDELALRRLLSHIKHKSLWATPEDTRSCREFVEYIKEVFIDEEEEL